MEIPRCDFAFIGGSSTLSLDITKDLGLDWVKTEKAGMIFQTPFGDSPEFILLSLETEAEPRKILTCRMHGWRRGVSRADASRQVFWVLQSAGVKKIIAEGGVGAINHLLRPRDLVIPHDYIDVSMRKDVGLGERYLMIMREALCPRIRKIILDTAEKYWNKRVFDRGIYVNTDGRHFESPAEVNMFKMAGGDLVGQSLCPEVYLAREIGACYAGLYMVVNYAEGIVSPWQHEELTDIFNNEALNMASLIMECLRILPAEGICTCQELRKDTLLKKVYE
ncbi:MTAP family purine nucleoside phosphorylase [Syntrophomonas palmitatica]|uniref:MTAP family purine nucleoside phosphorylase n=1 Tax=Syntrophomonas palmitatica TaxID=402877 RepID=UPI0006D06CE8|nr:MTAP family purine nucleoside phosphorylase [Syntrophomonas palmitatica]